MAVRRLPTRGPGGEGNLTFIERSHGFRGRDVQRHRASVKRPLAETETGHFCLPLLLLSFVPPISPTVSGPLVTLLDNRGSADNKRGPDEKLLPLFNADCAIASRTFFIELAIVLSWRIFENFFFLFFYCLLGEVGEVKLDWKCHCWKLRTESGIFFFFYYFSLIMLEI